MLVKQHRTKLYFFQDFHLTFSAKLQLQIPIRPLPTSAHPQNDKTHPVRICCVAVIKNQTKLILNSFVFSFFSMTTFAVVLYKRCQKARAMETSAKNAGNWCRKYLFSIC
jgi:hypothetical protein